MGLEIDRESFEPAEYERFEHRLRRSLEALEVVLARPRFGEGPPSIGAELEIDLVDARGLAPAMAVDLLRQRSGWYDDRVLTAMAGWSGPPRGSQVLEVPFSQLRAGMVFADQDEVVRYVNPAFMRLAERMRGDLRVTPENVVGSKLAHFHADHAHAASRPIPPRHREAQPTHTRPARDERRAGRGNDQPRGSRRRRPGSREGVFVS